MDTAQRNISKKSGHQKLSPIHATFSAYLNALPEHESSILTNYALLQGDAVATCALISDLQDVILVSDGGAMDNHGLFGWVLGLQNGTCLAHGFGIVFGHKPRSYRAEGYGAKAAALFLWHLFQYSNCTIPDAPEAGRFNYHCDNQVLLKKLAVFHRYKNAGLATCLHSEWDIVSSIHSLHSRFPWLPRLIHVKGHQDNHLHKDNLDLPTQMNIEDDALATKALQCGVSQPIIP
jgi:hypothetical protein